MKFRFLIAPVTLALFGCTDNDDNGFNLPESDSKSSTVLITDGLFTDSRDSKQYKVIKIDDFYWMAENLNYYGDKVKGEAWCLEDDKKNCDKYGSLYTFTSAKKACPKGWVLPTNAQWNALRKYIDKYNGDEGVGTSLKDTKSWADFNNAEKGTNRFRLAMLASGRRNNDGIDVMAAGKHAFYWTSTVRDEETAYGWALHYDTDVLDSGYYYQDHGMSVRCIVEYNDNVKLDSTSDDNWTKDPLEFDYGSLKVDGKTYKTIKIGTQTWMAENMNSKTDESWCIKDDEKYCEQYGRFYSWKDAQKVCPSGWHLPAIKDVNTLYYYVGTLQSLKSTDGWSINDGTDNWGFSALPAGGYESGSSFDLGKTAYFWLSNEMNDDFANQFTFKYYDNDGFISQQKKTIGQSVRCVKDE